jgi:hypothetical protein
VSACRAATPQMSRLTTCGAWSSQVWPLQAPGARVGEGAAACELAMRASARAREVVMRRGLPTFRRARKATVRRSLPALRRAASHA